MSVEKTVLDDTKGENVATAIEEKGNKEIEGDVVDSSPVSPEKIEETKLFSKYPNIPKNGQLSQFLQKRLQHRKYFDSGDYNMAKAKGMKFPVAIPLHSEAQVNAVVSNREGSTSPTGLEIPTPESVPHRKSSIVPEVASKLIP